MIDLRFLDACFMGLRDQSGVGALTSVGYVI